MDLEFVAVLVVLAVVWLPIAWAFPSRLLRVSLVVCWAGLSLAIPRGIDAYRAARITTVPDNRPIEQPREDYLGSKACGACHPHEYDTWKHTWHRTMTQLATPEAVFGDFDGVELETQGWKTTLERRGDEFFARIYEEDLSEYVCERSS